MTLNVLAHNKDQHAKNFAFIHEIGSALQNVNKRFAS
jgi:serine/threonine protein kinase HipA of HipAB toxin-antitoxin module